MSKTVKVWWGSIPWHQTPRVTAPNSPPRVISFSLNKYRIPDEFLLTQQPLIPLSMRDEYRDTHDERRLGEHPPRRSVSYGSHNSNEWLRYLPQGIAPPEGVLALDAISEAIAQAGPETMLDVLHSMREFILDHPDRARALLLANPQLAYALFQSLLVYGIVDCQILQRMMPAMPPRPATPPQVGYQIPTAPHNNSGAVAPGHAAALPSLPPATGATEDRGHPPLPYDMTSEDLSKESDFAMQSAASQNPQLGALKQLLQLPNEQVHSLPVEQRQAIEQLKAQIMELRSYIG